MKKIRFNGKIYQLLSDYKDGWDEGAFRRRYSDILDKYDYIVGDWGYGQLRLKGFFEDDHVASNRRNENQLFKRIFK